MAAAGEVNELSLSTATASCPNGGHKISWNIQGRSGRRGKTGGSGPAGSTGATGSQGQAGAKGDTGATGQPGPKGDQGLKGDQGTPGTPGLPGTNGTNGTNGTSVTSAALSAGDTNCPDGGSSFTAVSGTTYACNGAQGPKGDTGATGTLASAYLDAYSTTNVALASNDDFAFDTLALPPVGITTNAAQTAFTVSAAGTYLISVQAVAFSLPVGWRGQLTVNNAVIGFQKGSFLSLLSLGAGDVVTFRNVGNPASEGPGSEITIVRIS